MPARDGEQPGNRLAAVNGTEALFDGLEPLERATQELLGGR